MIPHPAAGLGTEVDYTSTRPPGTLVHYMSGIGRTRDWCSWVQSTAAVYISIIWESVVEGVGIIHGQTSYNVKQIAEP